MFFFTNCDALCFDFVLSHGTSLQCYRSWNMSGLPGGHPSSLILLQQQRVVKQYVKIAWLYWRQVKLFSLFYFHFSHFFLGCLIYILKWLLTIQFNNLQLLSEEIFDFSRGEMTQQKIKELKSSLNRLDLFSASVLGYFGDSSLYIVLHEDLLCDILYSFSRSTCVLT